MRRWNLFLALWTYRQLTLMLLNLQLHLVLQSSIASVSCLFCSPACNITVLVHSQLIQHAQHDQHPAADVYVMQLNRQILHIAIDQKRATKEWILDFFRWPETWIQIILLLCICWNCIQVTLCEVGCINLKDDDGSLLHMCTTCFCWPHLEQQIS